MNKCLVTRLQGVVEADNLPIFGMAKVLYCNKYYDGNTYLGQNLALLLVDADNGAIADTLRIKGKTTDNHSYFESASGNHFTGEVDLNWVHKYVNTSNSENSVFLFNIYEGSLLAGIVGNIDELPASDSLLAFEPLQDNGKDGVFYSSYGSLGNICEKYPNLMAFSAPWLNDLTGDIVEFGKCKSIAGIKINNTSKITGSIEALADALIANGRSTGLLKIVGNNKITYNGTAVANNATKYVKFANGSYTVSDTKPQ